MKFGNLFELSFELKFFSNSSSSLKKTFTLPVSRIPGSLNPGET